MGLSIGGVAYDGWLKRESVNHLSTLGSEPDTLDFELNPVDMAGQVCPPPALGAEVVYTWPGGAYLFGGVLTAAAEAPRAHKLMGYRCGALDWRVRADRAVLNDRYYDRTAGYVVADLFKRYAPEFDRAEIDTAGAVLGQVRFKRDTHITGALDRLSELTGYVWDITPDKRVLWGALGAQLAAFQMVDGFSDFDGLSVEPNRDQLRNRVIVRGGSYAASYTTTDRYTQDAAGLTASFRLTYMPHGTDAYEVFRSDFTGGIGDEWLQVDANNPTPPAGHIGADGYMMTTIQAGAAIAESGWLQVVGGTGTPGAVRLMGAEVQARADRRRFEWEVSATAITSEARFGLWDPNNQGAAAGELYAVWQDGGTLKASRGGAQIGGSSTTTITAGAVYRIRVTLKAAGGATIQVNKDSAGDLLLPVEERTAWRASQWTTLWDGATGTEPSATIAAVWNTSAQVRVRRIRVFNPLHGITLTVAGVAKVVGLLGVDEDSGCDALVGATTGDLPILAFFPDTRPAASAAVVCTYRQGIPILIEARDQASIDALAAIEDDPLVPVELRGVYSHFINDPSLTTRELAIARASQELENHAWPVVTLSFKTRTGGLRAGLLLQPSLTTAASGRDLSGTYLITQVSTTSKGGGNLVATVTASSKLRGSADYFRELLKLGKAADSYEDDNTPLEELLYFADVLTFDEEASVVAGPLGPYMFGEVVELEGGGLLLLESGELLLGEDSPNPPARWSLATFA